MLNKRQNLKMAYVQIELSEEKKNSFAYQLL